MLATSSMCLVWGPLVKAFSPSMSSLFVVLTSTRPWIVSRAMLAWGLPRLCPRTPSSMTVFGLPSPPAELRRMEPPSALDLSVYSDRLRVPTHRIQDATSVDICGPPAANRWDKRYRTLADSATKEGAGDEKKAMC